MDFNKKVRDILLKILSDRYAKAAGDNLPGRLKNVDIVELSNAQVAEIQRVWGGYLQSLTCAIGHYIIH